MSARTIIKTATPGWYEDPATGKKTRKVDGDQILTRDEFDALAAGNTNSTSEATTPEQVAAKSVEKAKDKPARDKADAVVLSTGKLAHGPVTTITCDERGCNTKRVIQVQDAFQVTKCIDHQKAHRLKRRRERNAARAAEAKK